MDGTGSCSRRAVHCAQSDDFANKLPVIIASKTSENRKILEDLSQVDVLKENWPCSVA